ncbi:MAG: UDP-N-acetylmuramoyl-L-alanine--D-glutamate ligase, partial [Deltaproteobacteria bacterium]
VGAVVKALESFSGPVVLLAGGRDKGGSYDPLVPLIKEKVRALILFGESRRHIAEYLGDLTNTWLVENLDEAVRVATTICKPGDVVLLSPACASFDQYKNYQERGLHFEALVRSL